MTLNGPEGFTRHLEKGLARAGLCVTDQQMDLMAAHAAELLAWNKKINLTAITRPDQVAEKHFVDSLIIAKMMQPLTAVLDIGSGGGFPAIPLKIVLPKIRFILVDSSRKKVNFLKHVIRTLGLDGIEAVHARVEDLHQDPEYEGQFDAVISRGFASLEKFADLSLPFLNPGGIILAMKGPNGVAEITPDLETRFEIQIDSYQLPFEKSDRCLIQMADGQETRDKKQETRNK